MTLFVRLVVSPLIEGREIDLSCEPTPVWKRVPFECECSDTVKELETKAFALLNIIHSTQKCHFIFNSLRLAPGKTLSEYGVENKNVIEMVAGLPEEAKPASTWEDLRSQMEIDTSSINEKLNELECRLKNVQFKRFVYSEALSQLKHIHVSGKDDTGELLKFAKQMGLMTL